VIGQDYPNFAALILISLFFTDLLSSFSLIRFKEFANFFLQGIHNYSVPNQARHFRYFL